MTHTPAELKKNVITKSQFLLSSSDASPPADSPRPDAPYTELALDQDALTDAYPNLACGPTLMAGSLEKLSRCDIFSVMVLRIDPVESVLDDATARTISLAAARAIDGICGREMGWWGLIDTHLFAAFIPNKNDPACDHLAQEIRSTMDMASPATLSVGIAGFPTADCARSQIVSNACKALDHAAFFGPDTQVVFDDVSLNISGDHLFQKGDINSAMAEFETALLLEPANVNVRNSLGVCHSLLGNFDRAVKEFETALKLAPEEFMAQYNLGLVHTLTDQRETALAHYLEADRISGDVYEVTLQTGRMYLELGKATDGIAYIEKALGLKPTALAYRLMGDCCRALNREAEAANAYKQAVKQNPNDAAALSALGLLYESRGENPEIAALFCEKSVEISPEDGIYRHRLGKLYLKQDRIDEALAAFNAAVERGYDSSRYIRDIKKLQAEPEVPMAENQ